MKIGIVTGSFYKEITDKMVEVAQEEANKHEFETEAVDTPGCFDVPFAVKKMLMRDDIVGVVTLGLVVRGKTDHDQVIAFSTAKSLQELSLEFNKPVTMGIQGPCKSKDQGEERIPRAAESMRACINLLNL